MGRPTSTADFGSFTNWAELESVRTTDWPANGYLSTLPPQPGLHKVQMCGFVTSSGYLVVSKISKEICITTATIVYRVPLTIVAAANTYVDGCANDHNEGERGQGTLLRTAHLIFVACTVTL